MYKNLINLQPQVLANAVSKGFWIGDQNKGERVMLMITEIGEAVDAHRKGALLAHNGFISLEKWSELQKPIIYQCGMPVDEKSLFLKWYESQIKHTVEEEVADLVIRILEYTAGFHLQLVERDYRNDTTDNFANDALQLTLCCINAYDQDEQISFLSKDWGYTLAAVIKFCHWYDIDLLEHVQWKMRYNESRPFKHNKKY